MAHEEGKLRLDFEQACEGVQGFSNRGQNRDIAKHIGSHIMLHKKLSKVIL